MGENKMSIMKSAGVDFEKLYLLVLAMEASWFIVVLNPGGQKIIISSIQSSYISL